MEQEIQTKNWWGRNWKWALPTGGCLLIVVLIIVFVVSLIGGVSSMFKNSEPYQYALQQASQNEWVQSKLGTEIEVEGMATGNVHFSDGDSTADLSIPIKGSLGEGNIIVYATKDSGEWEYEKLKVKLDDSDEVYDLLLDQLVPEE